MDLFQASEPPSARGNIKDLSSTVIVKLRDLPLPAKFHWNDERVLTLHVFLKILKLVVVFANAKALLRACVINVRHALDASGRVDRKDASFEVPAFSRLEVARVRLFIHGRALPSNGSLSRLIASVATRFFVNLSGVLDVRPVTIEINVSL